MTCASEPQLSHEKSLFSIFHARLKFTTFQGNQKIIFPYFIYKKSIDTSITYATLISARFLKHRNKETWTILEGAITIDIFITTE